VPLLAVYCASKAAVISLTQFSGLALIQQGIRVNAIAPGSSKRPCGTPWMAFREARAGARRREEGGLAVPAGRAGQPHNYYDAAVFLASADSDYVVAQTFDVNGGTWMG
jgi:NAD(P)-dependent dehydrogenase (short-subunit alcohol dehydrogenase family)